jgi:hypothetical protein
MSNVETTTARPPAPAAVELPPSPENLPIHPLADEHAMGDTHEQAAMSASIRDQGIIVPIVIWFWESKWWLLDGRNRVLCAKAVSYRFKSTDFKVFVGDLAAAAAFVEAVNGHRRHLSKEQKEERALSPTAPLPGCASPRTKKTPPTKPWNGRGSTQAATPKNNSRARSESISRRCCDCNK